MSSRPDRRAIRATRRPTAARPRPRPVAGERGSGLLSSVIGVGIVMALVSLSANVAIGLWTRSTVDAVAYDAARDVATAPSGANAQGEADEALRRASATLGPYGSRVVLRFERLDEQAVVLRVRAPGVALLPRIVDGGPIVGGLDRRITIQRERW